MTPGYDASAPPRPGEGSLRSDDHGTADGRAADSCGAAHDRGPADDRGTADARDTDAPGTADDHGACRAARGDEEFIGRAFIPREDGSVLGVGVDVVDIARLAGRIERTPALLERLFTPGERGLPSASRAARVAAKEAVGKALGAPGDFSWQDVTVRRTAARRPYLSLRGATLRAAERLGVGHLHLSLSHDGNIATAIVVAESEQPAASDTDTAAGSDTDTATGAGPGTAIAPGPDTAAETGTDTAAGTRPGTAARARAGQHPTEGGRS